MNSQTSDTRSRDARNIVEALLALSADSGCRICGNPVELAPETRITPEGVAHESCSISREKILAPFSDYLVKLLEAKEPLEE